MPILKHPVKFCFSPIYNEQFRTVFENTQKHERPYPNKKTIVIFLKLLETEWQKHGYKVFRAIERYSGIK